MNKTMCALQLSACLLFIAPRAVWSQEIEPTAGYHSQLDEDLTIRRATLLPVTDNVGGIYARPLEAELIRALNENHRFNFVEAKNLAQLPITDELEEDPAKVQSLGKTL